MGNWSQFCRPGSVLISATYNPQPNIFINACKTISTGQFAIIAVNGNSGSTSQNFCSYKSVCTKCYPLCDLFCWRTG